MKKEETIPGVHTFLVGEEGETPLKVERKTPSPD